jgi:hypothetical protein
MPTIHRVGALTLATLTLAALAGCSRNDAAATNDSSAAPATTPARTTSTSPADTIVRGTLASVSDSALAVSAAGGTVRIALVAPVQVYDRESADLSRVTEHTFIGVTSVPQPDGSQRATEIHIFPEELRGLGEGSRPLSRPDSSAGRESPGTMTNGTVAARGGSRMTNGAVRAQAGGTLTVEYSGGTQTITVPAGVTVTAIAPTKTPLAAGVNVVVLATRRPDGTLQSSRVLLAPRPRS